MRPCYAAERGLVDDEIDPAEPEPLLTAALEATQRRVETEARRTEGCLGPGRYDQARRSVVAPIRPGAGCRCPVGLLPARGGSATFYPNSRAAAVTEAIRWTPPSRR